MAEKLRGSMSELEKAKIDLKREEMAQNREIEMKRIELEEKKWEYNKQSSVDIVKQVKEVFDGPTPNTKTRLWYQWAQERGYKGGLSQFVDDCITSFFTSQGVRAVVIVEEETNKHFEDSISQILKPKEGHEQQKKKEAKTKARK